MRAAAAAGFFERIDKNRLSKMPVIPKIPEMITTFTAVSNVVPLREGKNFRLDFYIKTVGIQGQLENSRQNDKNLQTAADFFATRCAKGKICNMPTTPLNQWVVCSYDSSKTRVLIALRSLSQSARKCVLQQIPDNQNAKCNDYNR
jgi:hypothetical protein